MLAESEKRARVQYEALLREQKGQNVLLMNLQAIQNNMEKNEFEMKTRLGAQIESLEREVILLKQKLHSEEDRRAKMSEAYETQVKDLEGKLESVRTEHSTTQETLRTCEERMNGLSGELREARSELQVTQKSLEEATDRAVHLEHDPGSEYRQKIRLLERNLADSNDKCKNLEGQLELARQHVEQYKSMSLANEEALRDLNTTSEKFRLVVLCGENMEFHLLSPTHRSQCYVVHTWFRLCQACQLCCGDWEMGLELLIRWLAFWFSCMLINLLRLGAFFSHQWYFRFTTASQPSLCSVLY